MFKLKANPTFRCKVPLPVPGEVDVPVEFEFAHKTRAQLAVYIEATKGRKDGENLSEVIVDWSGVGDAAGEPIAYSREALEQLLDLFPGAGGRIATRYFEELAAAKLGN